jgi:hypothetical protein
VAHPSGSDQTIGAKPTAMPRDVEMGEVLGSAGKEAQEAIHYHRSQLAMWERVAAAVVAGLQALNEEQIDFEEGPMEQIDFEEGPMEKLDRRFR